jgi:hypothetical protein
MIEAIRFSETLILTRATRYNIPEDTILHSHRRENFKSYKLLLSNRVYKLDQKLFSCAINYPTILCLLRDATVNVSLVARLLSTPDAQARCG